MTGSLLSRGSFQYINELQLSVSKHEKYEIYVYLTSKLYPSLYVYFVYDFNTNNNKSMFSYLRTLTTWHCPPLLKQSIDISCPPGPQQQTCSSGVRRANGTDGQTDRRTPYRSIDSAPHATRRLHSNANIFTRTTSLTAWCMWVQVGAEAEDTSRRTEWSRDIWQSRLQSTFRHARRRRKYIDCSFRMTARAHLINFLPRG